MTRKNIITGLLIAFAIVVSSYDLPKGWFKAGSKPEQYDMGTDKGAGKDGKNVATIRSTSKKTNGFGTLMQTSLPDKYLGKRVRMSGYMKSENVEGWGSFWFRIDKTSSEQALAFDNMADRPVKGTTDWTKYEIVLDVPMDASGIAYGALLDGRGQIWFDNMDFEIVDKSVPVTGINLEILKTPRNLSFED